MQIRFDHLKGSVQGLVNAKDSMRDELNKLDFAISQIRDFAGKRLQNDFEHFAVIKERLLKEFDELEGLKVELNNAVEDFYR